MMGKAGIDHGWVVWVRVGGLIMAGWGGSYNSQITCANESNSK